MRFYLLSSQYRRQQPQHCVRYGCSGTWTHWSDISGFQTVQSWRCNTCACKVYWMILVIYVLVHWFASPTDWLISVQACPSLPVLGRAMGAVDSTCCRKEESPLEVKEVVQQGAYPSPTPNPSGNPNFKGQDGKEEPEGYSDASESCGDSVGLSFSEHPSARSLTPLDRLQTLSHFEVDQEMLRGIALKDTLKFLGTWMTWSPWLKPAIDLPNRARERVWQRSSRVEKLDLFISHTWETSGGWKILALLLQSGWDWMLTGWLAGISLGIIVEVLEILPPTVSRNCWFRDTCEYGPWIPCGAAFGSFIGLVSSPYLPSLFCRREMCFLDAVCINQVNPELKERGIYGIGGFLAVSSELRILWSRPYLSRPIHKNKCTRISKDRIHIYQYSYFRFKDS